MKRITAIILSFIILTLNLFTSNVIFAEEMPQEGQEDPGQSGTPAVEISAPSAVLMEASTGKVIFEKDMDTARPPASVTKIMTMLLIFDALADGRIRPEDEVTVSEYAASMGGSQVYLEAGEVQTVDTMLKCIAVASANDACVAMAEEICGSEEEFVKLMNQKASELGLKNTSFANAHGLDSEGHYTSAYDLAMITAEAMKNPTFCEIVKTKNVTVSGNEEVSGKALKNKNKLLWSMEGCEGVKTGFTDNAKRCFVCSAKRDGMRLICVVLNCGPMFEEAERLLNMGFDNFKIQ